MSLVWVLAAGGGLAAPSGVPIPILAGRGGIYGVLVGNGELLAHWSAEGELLDTLRLPGGLCAERLNWTLSHGQLVLSEPYSPVAYVSDTDLSGWDTLVIDPLLRGGCEKVGYKWVFARGDGSYLVVAKLPWGRGLAGVWRPEDGSFRLTLRDTGAWAQDHIFVSSLLRATSQGDTVVVTDLLSARAFLLSMDGRLLGQWRFNSLTPPELEGYEHMERWVFSEAESGFPVLHKGVLMGDCLVLRMATCRLVRGREGPGLPLAFDDSSRLALFYPREGRVLGDTLVKAEILGALGGDTLALGVRGEGLVRVSIGDLFPH